MTTDCLTDMLINLLQVFMYNNGKIVSSNAMAANHAFISLPPLHLPRTLPKTSRRSTKMTLRPTTKQLADMTKYTVSLSVACTILYSPTPTTLLYVSGSLLNTILGKALKHSLRQPRPQGAAKTDPGMPSSHAVSLSYLSLAPLIYSLVYGGRASLCVLAGALVVAGGVASAWRVRVGYHTTEQVGAGWALGGLNAAVWVGCVQWLRPVVATSVGAHQRLAAGALLAVCTFVFYASEAREFRSN